MMAIDAYRRLRIRPKMSMSKSVIVIEKTMDQNNQPEQITTLSDRRGRRTLGEVALQLAVQTFVLLIVFSGFGRADALDNSLHATHGIDAKMSYCEDCHGRAGQGYFGFYPIPRLAGQQIAYFENQLRAFVEQRRTNNIMSNVARDLSSAMISALARNFRALIPQPLGGGPKNLVAAGREIFQDGLPDANIAACSACHGPDATGVEQIPRLAGQLYPYVVKELTNWGKERGRNTTQPNPSTTMLPIAHSLSKRQIEAVAAYVSYLK